MKLSVALCTYNGERFFVQQLESIINQSLPIHEIIVVDDCSTDDTTNLIKTFSIHCPLIKLFINQTNLGAKVNFEKAIAKCTGDIVFLSDQDDSWMPDKVEQIVNTFLQQPELEAIFTDGLLIDDCGKSLDKTLFQEFGFDSQLQHEWRSDGAVLRLLKGENKITGATLAIRRSLFERSRPFNLPEGYWHDTWLGLNAAMAHSLSWINAPLIKYRVHNQQQVGLKPHYSNSGHLSLRQYYIGFVPNEEKRLSYVQRVLDSSYANKQKILNDRDLNYKKRVEQLKLVKFRLDLPKNRLYRLRKVFANMNLYKRGSQKPVPEFLNDIIRPL